MAGMDELADKNGNGTLKITTRQTFQMHGILKWNMKKHDSKKFHSAHDGYHCGLRRCKPERHMLCKSVSIGDTCRKYTEWVVKN